MGISSSELLSNDFKFGDQLQWGSKSMITVCSTIVSEHG